MRLRTVGNQLNRTTLIAWFRLSDSMATPTGSTWRILIDDRNAPGIREVEVRGGRRCQPNVRSNIVGTAQGATINPATFESGLQRRL